MIDMVQIVESTSNNNISSFSHTLLHYTHDLYNFSFTIDEPLSIPSISRHVNRQQTTNMERTNEHYEQQQSTSDVVYSWRFDSGN